MISRNRPPVRAVCKRPFACSRPATGKFAGSSKTAEQIEFDALDGPDRLRPFRARIAPSGTTLPFGQPFCAPADLLQNCFELFELLRCYILKYVSDQSGMPAKEGVKYLLPFFRQRNR